MRFPILLEVLLLLLPCALIVGQDATSADSLLAVARKQAALKDYPASIQAYRSYLLNRRTDNDVRNELARTLAWNGQYDEALTQYDSVLQSDAPNFDARYGKCQTLAWRGNLPQAISESDTLVVRFRGNIDALLLSALLHARGKDFDRSLERNRLVLTEDPDNVEAMIGECLALEGLGKNDEAYAEISRFRERKKGNAEIEKIYESLSPKPRNQLFVRFQNESFDVAGRRDFRTFEAQAYRALQENLTMFVQFDSYRRFDRDDQSVGAGIYYTPASGQSLFGYALVSPNPRVTSSVDASLEYEYGFTPSSSAILDYRLLAFKTETAHIFSPGFMWQPGSAFELRPRAYITRTVLSKTTSYAFLVRASYEGWDAIEPFLYYSVGTEAFRGVTLDNIESAHSWSLTGGAKVMATNRIIVRVNYEYLNRIGQFRESSFDVGVGYLW